MGWPESANTWQTAHDLRNAQKLVDRFENSWKQLEERTVRSFCFIYLFIKLAVYDEGCKKWMHGIFISKRAKTAT